MWFNHIRRRLCEIEPCSSRFFDDGFFTRTMFTTVEPIGRFMYPFENMRQVNLVLKIKSI
jgi:hypothetical protein